MFSSSCWSRVSTCGELSKCCGAESPERMSSVNGGGPILKPSESYWDRVKHPVIGLMATIASIALFALMATQPVQSAEKSPGG